MKLRLLLALGASLLASPALADTLVDNINGITVDRDGEVTRFSAMVIDDHAVFVGSYNLDPRSTSLNCEQGILVDHPALAAELATLFTRQTAPDHAWKVTLDAGGRLHWSDGVQAWDREPEATVSQRSLAWLMRILPVESQL